MPACCMVMPGILSTLTPGLILGVSDCSVVVVVVLDAVPYCVWDVSPGRTGSPFLGSEPFWTTEADFEAVKISPDPTSFSSAFFAENYLTLKCTHVDLTVADYNEKRQNVYSPNHSTYH